MNNIPDKGNKKHSKLLTYKELTSLGYTNIKISGLAQGRYLLGYDASLKGERVQAYWSDTAGTYFETVVGLVPVMQYHPSRKKVCHGCKPRVK